MTETEYKYLTCRKKTSRVSNKDYTIIFDTIHKERQNKLDELIYNPETGVFINRSNSPICLSVCFGFPKTDENENFKTWFYHSKTGNTGLCQTSTILLLPDETFCCCYRPEERHILIIDQPPNAYVQICKL